MTVTLATFDNHGPSDWAPWDGAVPETPAEGFVWIDVVDAGGEELAALQQTFGLHELAIEDSMSDTQLAKVDLYPDHIFVLAKAAELSARQIDYADVAIFLSPKRVITLCRMDTALVRRTRANMRGGRGRAAQGADFVVHHVLDAIADDYLPLVQGIADEVLAMERRLLDGSLSRDEIGRIFTLRRETIHFQHALARMTELCTKLANLDLPCISETAKPYFRDVVDHLTRIEAMSTGLIDVIRSALEASSLLEQQRQSAITRQLAAWAAILAVPTALAGILGMNFAAIPGTQSRWGFAVTLAMMAVLCAGLYWRFVRLGWLQPAEGRMPKSAGAPVD
ncbi:MAG: yfjQ [Bradyrhizobium sp.]|nr:yfjQ [Bradyrhizobium sp.]